MPIETGGTISELDKSWPLGTDQQLDGDDHLRLIKSVLQSQFPGLGGLGYSIVILATEAELNYLSGVTSNVQVQITLNADNIAINVIDIAELQISKADIAYVDLRLLAVDPSVGTTPPISGDNRFSGFKHTWDPVTSTLNLITS